ncbi:uncharacterized protein GGS22DRAFT_186579 [Annulohypoxylon maeteangense]|uniref:uncharacterized protein n=1 Tax=Annulohypoxylon maeteangense TaxID=1927788 RepID=UPI0020074729|nr:uncharacterized protein GGS22DRAFT_186579 [Annulohypoxylon maeteangense]KAI0886509.1 hypothetical protein GGS22DRAFT_186579 [Annulohypoxylon maeteangense]
MANPHPIKAIPEEQDFHPHDSLKSGIKGAILGGSAGFITAAVQNSLAKTNIGAWSVLTRGGGTIAMFTAVTSVYTFSKDATANLREKDDTWNTTVASFLGGATIGLRTGRVPQILGFGAGFAAIMSAFEYTGGSLRGRARTENPEMDEYEYKESQRKTRRRPVEETLVHIGEGRGTKTFITTRTTSSDNMISTRVVSCIKPEGYEERRRERLKEKYGVEINPVRADGL